jgi:probable F420-dependent oxidoreductase
MPRSIAFGANTSTRGAMNSRAAYLAVARAADRSGFDFLSVNDHVVVPKDFDSKYPYAEDHKWVGGVSGYCMDVLSTLSFLAAATERVRLLTSVMVVPHRQPVLTAKMLATADLLSGGRVVVGCGAGWLREEFEALETKPYTERGRVTDEYIEAFKELWSKEVPTYRGKHVSFADLKFEPKPLQSPLPIWIGGESPAAKRRAARLGDAWYPASANPEFRLDTTARLGAGIADVHRICREQGRDPASLGLAYIVLTPVDWTARPGHDSPRRMFTGSSADMAADAAALAALGIRHVNLSFQTLDAGETVERMQRFAEEVVPLVA